METYKALEQLVLSLRDGTPPSSDVAEWAIQGIENFRLGKGNLDKCLGITSVERVKARNQALLDAAEIIDPQFTLSSWERAALLEDAIKRFERSKVWRRIRAGEEVNFSPLDDAIHRSLTSGARRLSCQRRLYDLIH